MDAIDVMGAMGAMGAIDAIGVIVAMGAMDGVDGGARWGVFFAAVMAEACPCLWGILVVGCLKKISR